MVRTLKNAFAADRIAQAFIMTGIRGTGKTTTARIIAKGLNCIGPDGTGGPTTDPCGKCEHCVAIMEGRHVDVMEMDAASPHRRRRHPRDHRERALPGRLGALQDLHHRRSPHAVDERLQRASEDAGGTARPCEVHLRHDRDPQGAGHGSVALPALRPAPDRARGDDRAPAQDRQCRKAPRSPTTRSRSSPAPPKARRATRPRCSIRRSPTARARPRPSRSARCWAWPTGAASSTSST